MNPSEVNSCIQPKVTYIIVTVMLNMIERAMVDNGAYLIVLISLTVSCLSFVFIMKSVGAARGVGDWRGCLSRSRSPSPLSLPQPLNSSLFIFR